MMPATLKRRRGLIFKVIVGIPILWFSFIGFTVVISGGGGFPPENYGGMARSNDIRANSDNGDSDTLLAEKRTRYPRVKGRGDNLEPPNPDRLRFEERVRKDAEDRARTTAESRKSWWRHTKNIVINKNPAVAQGDLNLPPKMAGDDPNGPGTYSTN